MSTNHYPLATSHQPLPPAPPGIAAIVRGLASIQAQLDTLDRDLAAALGLLHARLDEVLPAGEGEHAKKC